MNHSGCWMKRNKTSAFAATGLLANMQIKIRVSSREDWEFMFTDVNRNRSFQIAETSATHSSMLIADGSNLVGENCLHASQLNYGVGRLYWHLVGFPASLAFALKIFWRMFSLRTFSLLFFDKFALRQHSYLLNELIHEEGFDSAIADCIKASSADSDIA